MVSNACNANKTVYIFHFTNTQQQKQEKNFVIVFHHFWFIVYRFFFVVLLSDVCMYAVNFWNRNFWIKISNNFHGFYGTGKLISFWKRIITLTKRKFFKYFLDNNKRFLVKLKLFYICYRYIILSIQCPGSLVGNVLHY